MGCFNAMELQLSGACEPKARRIWLGEGPLPCALLQGESPMCVQFLPESLLKCRASGLLAPPIPHAQRLRQWEPLQPQQPHKEPISDLTYNTSQPNNPRPAAATLNIKGSTFIFWFYF